jgi:hypothetical protein
MTNAIYICDLIKQDFLDCNDLDRYYECLNALYYLSANTRDPEYIRLILWVKEEIAKEFPLETEALYGEQFDNEKLCD